MVHDFDNYGTAMIIQSRSVKHMQSLVFISYLRVSRDSQLLVPATITSRSEGREDRSWFQKQLSGHLLNYEGQRLLSASDEVLRTGVKALDNLDIECLDHRAYGGAVSFNTALHDTDDYQNRGEDDALGKSLIS